MDWVTGAGYAEAQPIRLRTVAGGIVTTESGSTPTRS